MRVIAGEVKGHRLSAVPGKNTRPTSDKVKEAIFSRIGPYFNGGVALDLFAGTGALGIESLSRGIDSVVFIDVNRMAIRTIHDNLRRTGFSDHASVFHMDANRAYPLLKRNEYRFDLVFIDPPYTFTNVQEAINSLQRHQLLNRQATIVVEHDASLSLTERIESASMSRSTKYGDTAVTIYDYIE